MANYRNKPVEVEVLHFTSDLVRSDLFYEKIRGFLGPSLIGISRCYPSYGSYIAFEALDGDMQADIGDYIVKYADEEFQAFKPKIFKKEYELVEGVEPNEPKNI